MSVCQVLKKLDWRGGLEEGVQKVANEDLILEREGPWECQEEKSCLRIFENSQGRYCYASRD